MWRRRRSSRSANRPAARGSWLSSSRAGRISSALRQRSDRSPRASCPRHRYPPRFSRSIRSHHNERKGRPSSPSVHPSLPVVSDAVEARPSDETEAALVELWSELFPGRVFGVEDDSSRSVDTRCWRCVCSRGSTNARLRPAARGPPPRADDQGISRYHPQPAGGRPRHRDSSPSTRSSP